MSYSKLLLTYTFAVLLSLTATAKAQVIPKGFVVPECTISPGGRYGVTVPVSFGPAASENVKNSVIDLRTGRIIAVIYAKFTGWNKQNHGGVLPSRWSPDGSLLLWDVDGKWFADALVFLKFKKGVLEWQTDLLASAQTEILARTKRIAPEEYAAAKQWNAGSGSAYPDGFTVFVAAAQPIALPIKVCARLTANPKHVEDGPKLGSELHGVLDKRGRFLVKTFRRNDSAYDQLSEASDYPEICPRDYTAEEKAVSK